MIAQQDNKLLDWLLGIVRKRPNRSGSFLQSLADTAMRADAQNYPILRPALLEIQKKYPQYSYQKKDSGNRGCEGPRRWVKPSRLWQR